MFFSSSSSSSKPPPNYNQTSLEELLNERIDASPLIRKRRQRHNEINPQLSTEEQTKVERKQKLQENQRLKLHIDKLKTFREELDARLARLREFLHVELDWEKMVKEVYQKVREFERLLKPHFEKGVRETLRLPEPFGIFEEYHRRAVESQKVEFQPPIVFEEEQVRKARQEFNDYEKEAFQDWPIFCNLKRMAKLAEVRFDTYKLWVHVEKTKLMLAKFKMAKDWVKKEMWEKIVSQYVSFTMQLQATSSSPEALQNVAKAVLFFAPFSTSGHPSMPVQVAEVSSSTSSGKGRVVPMIVRPLEQDPCDSTTVSRSSTPAGCSRTTPMIMKTLQGPCDSTSSGEPRKIVKMEPIPTIPNIVQKQWVPPKELKMETPSAGIPQKKTLSFSIERILNLPPSVPAQKTNVEPKIEPVFEPCQAKVNSQCSSGNNERTAPEPPFPIISRKRPPTSSPAHDFKRAHLEPPAQYQPPPNDFYAQFNQFPLVYNMAPAPPQSVNNNWTPYMAQGYQGY